MEPTMKEQNWATPEQFVTEFNRHRLANPGRWIGYVGDVCGKQVTIKNYGKWLQRLTVNGVKYQLSCEVGTVKEWKGAIINALEGKHA